LTVLIDASETNPVGESESSALNKKDAIAHHLIAATNAAYIDETPTANITLAASATACTSELVQYAGDTSAPASLSHPDVISIALALTANESEQERVRVDSGALENIATTEVAPDCGPGTNAQSSNIKSASLASSTRSTAASLSVLNASTSTVTNALSGGNILPHKAAKVAPGAEGGKRPLRALVVEDEPVTRKMMCRIFISCGIDAVSAENGLQAVEMVRAWVRERDRDGDQHSYRDRDKRAVEVGEDSDARDGKGDTGLPVDVIFMDFTMPVMDGVEAMKQIRAMGVQTPIVAVTGNTLKEDVELFASAGASAFLSKPCCKKDLMDIVTSLTM
jgi:CheY-like chemotaxis protein